MLLWSVEDDLGSRYQIQQDSNFNKNNSEIVSGLFFCWGGSWFGENGIVANLVV